MSNPDTTLLKNLIREILTERDEANNAQTKKLVQEGITSSMEFFNYGVELNKILAAINDLSISVNQGHKAPKAPSSKQGAAAKSTGAAAGTAGAAGTTAGASVAKLNIMQFGKQELSTNNELIREYEAKITEKDPKEIDRIKALDTITNKKNDVEKRKAYAGELYKAIKDNHEDIMKDLRMRHEKWKTEQQKDDHPEKLAEGGDATPAAAT